MKSQTLTPTFQVEGQLIKANSRTKGAYSYYLRLGHGLGLKVLTSLKHRHKGKAQLQASGLYKQAVRELNLLQELNPLGLTPMAFDILLVRDVDSGLLFPGILMEHCPGRRLNSLFHENPKKTYPFRGRRMRAWPLKESLEKYLYRHKVHHRDLHFGNIIVSKKGTKIWVIDFGLAQRVP